MLATRSNEDLRDTWSSHMGCAAHLHLSGELDLATEPFLEKLLSRAESNGNNEIVVDLENVTFMSISTLRSFLGAADRARESGRSFALVMAPPVVRRILEITGTRELLGSITTHCVEDLTGSGGLLARDPSGTVSVTSP